MKQRDKEMEGRRVEQYLCDSVSESDETVIVHTVQQSLLWDWRERECYSNILNMLQASKQVNKHAYTHSPTSTGDARSWQAARVSASKPEISGMSLTKKRLKTTSSMGTERGELLLLLLLLELL